MNIKKSPKPFILSKFHFLKWFDKNGMIEIIHCKSKQHVNDKFIKALKLELFVKHTHLLDVCT